MKILRSYVSLVHEILDKAEIPHFVHHVSDNSIFIYVSNEFHPYAAVRMLQTIPFAKSAKCGIDEDNDCWVELYF